MGVERNLSIPRHNRGSAAEGIGKISRKPPDDSDSWDDSSYYYGNVSLLKSLDLTN